MAERTGAEDGYSSASLAALTGRALMILRAGFALKMVGSFVNGLMPYNVPDASELVDLKPGDLITAILVVVRDDIHLEDIKKVVAAR